MAITLQELLRGMFYAPFYVALAREAYAEEGVDGALRQRAHARPTRRSACWMARPTCAGAGRCGSCRPMPRRRTATSCSFAEVVTRDPFLLLGRDAASGLCPARPAGPARGHGERGADAVDVPAGGPAPRRHGASGANARVGDRTMADNVAALRRGEVDVVQVFEPFAAALEAEGAGHVWYAQREPRADQLHDVLYAACAARDRREELHGMVRAIYRTLEMGGARGRRGDRRRDRAASSPDVPPALLAAACARYKALGIWGDRSGLPRAGYDRLLRQSGLGRVRVARHAVRSGGGQQPRRAVVAEDPPPLD